MTFAELGLSDKVLAAVASAGYETPTPIQQQAIPHVLGRRDVIGIAQTGTGKTASFTLPMLTMLEKGRARARMPRTLILEPTRELAAQVEQSFVVYGAKHKLSVALLIGGVSFGDQDRLLTRGVDVLIATPGRLLDHFERGRLLLTGVEILVIDEADRMLDMGFIPDIERICKLLPPTRQTLFFSATMAPEIQRLTGAFLKDPIRIEVSRPSSTVKTVEQSLVASGSQPWQKRDTLRRLLNEAENLQNALIFCNRKRDVATLHRSLQRHGFDAGALHGDMDQHARTATLEKFRAGEVAILVASDVAARGLDIPAVSHVFNFDVPIHAEDYVHRIGRTGRAGRKGTAYSIATRADSKYVGAIEKLTGEDLSWHNGREAIEADDGAAEIENRRGRGRGGRRSGGERQSRKPASQPEAISAEATESGIKPERPPARSRSRKRDASDAPRHEPAKSGQGRRDEPVVGLGDHVPAFLLRPVRLSSR